MKKSVLTLMVMSAFLFGGPVSALINNEVTVNFKTPVTPQFIQTLSQTFKLQVLAQVDKDTWRFKIPALRTQEQYTELFSSLPAVQSTEPMPVYNLADQIQPQAVHIVPQDTGASPVPGTGPGGFPQGTAAYTQIPLDGGGQMLVDFRPGTPKAAISLFYQLYGTREVRQESFYSYRIQLPQGLNPALAVRIFSLYPHINNVQRLYS